MANKASLSVTRHPTPKSCCYGGSPVYFDEHPCFIVHTKRQKEAGKAIDESLGRVRSERVKHMAQLHDSYMMMTMMMMSPVFDA